MKCDQILSLLLNCGTEELRMLENIRYSGLPDVIYALASQKQLDFESVVRGVCSASISEIKKEIFGRMPVLQAELKQYSDLNDTGEEDLPEELVHVPEVYRYGYMDIENFSIPAGEDLKKLDYLDPEKDIQLQYNASATRLYIVNYPDVYSRLFRRELDDLEQMCGIPIANITVE